MKSITTKWMFFIVSMLLLFNILVFVDVPLFKQFFIPIFLLFFPGLLIVQIIKLDNIRSSLQIVLYSLAFSITYLMFTGWAINFIFHFVGFKYPLSSLVLMVVFNASFIIMSIVGHIINPSFSAIFSQIKFNEIKIPIVLLSVLLPILSILGMFLTNSFGNNIILVFMILLMSLMILLATLEIIPKNHYPLVIFSSSLALVYFGSLISYYIAGGWMDMGVEFFNFNAVVQNGYWDSSGPSNVNTMLSVTIFPAIINILSGLKGEIIFRFIFPFIFAFVPLALYETYRVQSNKKIAFLAIVFFMAMPTFFQMIPLLSRMCVSELFFALIIMTIINEKIRHYKSSLLLVLFAASLTVSHYGNAYFFIFFVLLLLLFSFILQHGVWNFFKRIFIKKNRLGSFREMFLFLDEKIVKSDKKGMYITWTFALFFIVFTLTWYIFISSSYLFNDVVTILSNVYESIFTDLFNVSARESTTLAAVGMQGASSFWHIINRVIWYLTELFVIIGFFGILTKKYNFKLEFIIFSVVGCLLLLLSVVLPNFSGNFSIYRIYHFSLFFLAPLCIIGGLNTFTWLHKIVSKHVNFRRKPDYLNFLVIIVVIPYLLFNIGLVFNYTDDVAPYTPFNVGQYQNSNDVDMQCTYLAYHVPKKDFFGAKWLANSRAEGSNIYSDYTSSKYLFMLYPIPYNQTGKLKIIKENMSEIGNKQVYIFLREFNIVNNKMIISKNMSDKVNSYSYNFFNTSKFFEISSNKNLIYTNGGDLIYL